MASTFQIYGEQWKRFASLFKGFLGLEMRVEARRAYKYTHKEKKDRRIMDEQVQGHKVIAAIRTFDHFVEHVAKAISNTENLALGQNFQYFHILKIANHFKDAIGKFISHARKRAQSDAFRNRVAGVIHIVLSKMIAAFKGAEQWGTDDIKTVMAIVNETANKKTAEFIADFRNRMKQEQTISTLGRFPLRADIRREVRSESGLESLSRNLEALISQMDRTKSQAKYDALLDRFERIIEEGEHDLENIFRSAHLIMKRDLMLMMLVLIDERIIEKLGPQWVYEHFMPEVPVKKRLTKIEAINRQLGEKAHTLALGLGVVVKGEKSLEYALDRMDKELRSRPIPVVGGETQAGIRGKKAA